MQSLPFLSYNAVRVPPIQFQTYVGNPPRLTTTDMMSGCGGISLPGGLAKIFKLLHDNLAYIDAIANSAINQIMSAMSYAIGTLTNFIADATGQLLTDLQAMLGAILGSGMSAISDQIGSIVNNMPSLASMISSMGGLGSSLGLPPLASLNSIFGPIIDGTLNTILGPVQMAMAEIESALGTAMSIGIEAIAGVISGLTSALSSAVATVTGPITAAIGGIMNQISAALGNVMHMASAAALSVVCAGASELNSFVDSIASPALKEALPPPQ